MMTPPELPKGDLKGLQGFPTPVRQPWPLSVPCPATLQTISIPFWYYAIIHGSLNLLPGSYRFFYSSHFVQISISCFYNLEFATYRAEATQLGAPGSCVVLLSLLSCEPKIHYTRGGPSRPHVSQTQSDHKSGWSTHVLAWFASGALFLLVRPPFTEGVYRTQNSAVSLEKC